jgi:hypothetical protein
MEGTQIWGSRRAPYRCVPATFTIERRNRCSANSPLSFRLPSCSAPFWRLRHWPNPPATTWRIRIGTSWCRPSFTEATRITATRCSKAKTTAGPWVKHLLFHGPRIRVPPKGNEHCPDIPQKLGRSAELSGAAPTFFRLRRQMPTQWRIGIPPPAGCRFAPACREHETNL